LFFAPATSRNFQSDHGAHHQAGVCFRNDGQGAEHFDVILDDADIDHAVRSAAVGRERCRQVPE
jgi:hypothetical protein